MIEKREFYINGAWVSPSKARDCEVIDPSTEEACAVISLGSSEDTDKAVAAAKAAFDSWSRTDPETRLGYVKKIREVYAERAEDMAQAISLEMGAPIAMSRAQPSHVRHLAHRQFHHRLQGHRIHPAARVACAPMTASPWNRLVLPA